MSRFPALPPSLQALNPHLTTTARASKSTPRSLAYAHRWEDHALVVRILGFRLESLTNGSHGRWQGAAAKVRKIRAMTRDALCTELGADGLSCWPTVLAFPLHITFTRYAPSGGFDDDNLPPAFKNVRDETAKWLGLPNDRDPRVAWAYDQIDTRAKEHRAGWDRGWGITIRFEPRERVRWPECTVPSLSRMPNDVRARLEAHRDQDEEGEAAWSM